MDALLAKVNDFTPANKTDREAANSILNKIESLHNEYDNKNEILKRIIDKKKQKARRV